MNNKRTLIQFVSLILLTIFVKMYKLILYYSKIKYKNYKFKHEMNKPRRLNFNELKSTLWFFIWEGVNIEKVYKKKTDRFNTNIIRYFIFIIFINVSITK